MVETIAMSWKSEHDERNGMGGTNSRMGDGLKRNLYLNKLQRRKQRRICEDRPSLCDNFLLQTALTENPSFCSVL